VKVVGGDRSKKVEKAFTFGSNTARVPSSPPSLTEIGELDILPSFSRGVKTAGLSLGPIGC
jgi:hypothetical protein